MASNPVPPKAKPKSWVHHKMSDDKALRILPGLRAGLTLHQVHEVPRRFQVYCDAHPEYAREARPLVAANAEAARLSRGAGLRTTTHCRASLHLMKDNVLIDGTNGRKRCLACRRASTEKASVMRPEVVEAVKRALQGGASQICQGKPPGGGKTDRRLVLTQAKVLYRHRRENPEFDRLVIEAIADSNTLGQKLRFSRARARAQSEAKREEINDYHKIRAMMPAGFPDKDDVVSAILEDLLTGALKREDVKGACRATSRHTIECSRRNTPSSATARWCHWMRRSLMMEQRPRR